MDTIGTLTHRSRGAKPRSPVALLSVDVVTASGIMLLSAVASSCSPLAWGIVGGAAGICTFAPSRWNHAYSTQYQPHVVRIVESGQTDVRLGFLEADDRGWMRDTMQASVLLDSLQALHARSNVVVVVYAHGWRHNASSKDADVQSFQATLRHLARQLHSHELEERRAELFHDPKMTVFGIYIGWRGKAWPELGRYVPVLGPALIDWPVYLTTFGRKASSEVVGHGDVRMFLLRLDDMHREINDEARQLGSHVRPIGLVVVGHSYGGQMVFDALGERIEAAMATAITGDVGRTSSGLSERIYPASPLVPRQRCLRQVRGVGDLVVLINPAIEASAYRRIDGLVRSTRFRPDQLPVLITVSAEDDGARKQVFPFMRRLQHAGEASLGRAQQELERSALGVVDAQVTNDLLLSDRTPANRSHAKRRVIDGGRDVLQTSYSNVRPPSLVNSYQLAHPDSCPPTTPLFEDRSIGIVRMRPDETTSARIIPALVIRSSRDIIGGHSDFFRAEFVNWLTSYIMQIEELRLVNYRCRLHHARSISDDSSSEP
jgi:hypothetical protein